MYESVDELLNEIAAGEDDYLEFKEVIFRNDQPRFARDEGSASKVIAEVFISLANSDGGAVLFGVNKEGGVVGIDVEKRHLLEQWVVNCALDGCHPKGSLDLRLNWRNLANGEGVSKLVLQANVPKSRYYVHHTSDGKYLKRTGSHRTPVIGHELGRLLTSRSLSAPYEELPCFTTTLDDFSQDRFEAYYQRRFQHPSLASGLPLERLLENLKLATSTEEGRWHLTNLGVLLFSHHPQKWFPSAYVEIAVHDHAEADGNTLDVKRLEGAVNEQIDQAVRYLLQTPHCAVRAEKTALGRMDKPTFSGHAIQEAVVNAVVHRDYELNSQIIINLFPDRMEIRNPGGLHNSLKPENLYAGCQPIRRNQLLAGFFRDFPNPLTGASLMEARGVGFLSLVRESEQISGIKPTLQVIGQGVKLTIFAGGEMVD